MVGLLHKKAVLGGDLTIGEKKKLELARALATQSKLLLLDEVMSGLTGAEIDAVMDAIERVADSGVTILMIEHLVGVILALADRVLVLNFGRELFRHAREGWILHLHTAGNRTKAWTVAMSVATAGQMFRAPTVLTVHAGLVRKLFATDSSLRRRAQVAMVGYQHVVAVSEDVREGLLDAGIKPSRVSALPAFIASEVRPGDPPPQLNAIRRRRTPLLAVAHHPNPLYGRKLIFDALSRLAPKYPRIGLALFGPETGSAEYHADAERFGVSGLLEDFGELDNPQALAVIREADVFVRPTSSDGDSVSVREALTLGVPCVATDVAVRPPGTTLARRPCSPPCSRPTASCLTRPGWTPCCWPPGSVTPAATKHTAAAPWGPRCGSPNASSSACRWHGSTAGWDRCCGGTLNSPLPTRAC